MRLRSTQQLKEQYIGQKNRRHQHVENDLEKPHHLPLNVYPELLFWARDLGDIFVYLLDNQHGQILSTIQGRLHNPRVLAYSNLD